MTLVDLAIRLGCIVLGVICSLFMMCFIFWTFIIFDLSH